MSYLRGQDYICEVADNFGNAMEKTEMFEYDCILLDISLPGGSGLEILRELKDNNKMDGVIIISAKNSLGDKIKGLSLGADDYLPKPFHLSELSARIAAIIRRRNFNGSTSLIFNEITIDTVAKVAYTEGKVLDLTKKEFELLLYFISNKSRVISKNA